MNRWLAAWLVLILFLLADALWIGSGLVNYAKAAGGVYAFRYFGLAAYFLMTWTILKSRNALDAAEWGLIIYGIFNLTNLFLFQSWTYPVALADTLWDNMVGSTQHSLEHYRIPPSKKTTTSDATHQSMNGGNYKVSLEPTDYQDFLKVYLRALENKEPMYLTERTPKTDPFRFFMDLDFEWDLQVNFREWYKELKTILQSVLPGPVFLSTRLNKVHVHCPTLIVTRNQAVSWLVKCQEALVKVYPKLSGTKTFDKSVYSSGLRMLGSMKPLHKSSHDEPATAPKIYHLLDDDCEPVSLLNDDSTEAKIAILMQMSIFNLDGAELYQPGTETAVASSSSTEPIKTVHHFDLSDLTNHRDVTDFIYREYGHIDAKIKQIKAEGKSYIVELEERYCHFVRRSHRSNRQYLVINTEHGVSQRCHDSDCQSHLHHNIPFDKLPLILQSLFIQGLRSVSDVVKDLVKDHEPVEIGEPKKRGAGIIVPIKFKSCPLCRGDGMCSHLEIIKNTGEAYISCVERIESTHPNEPWTLDRQKLAIIFNGPVNIVNNNYTTIYAGDNADIDVTFDIVYEIFDDRELNALCYRALDGTTSHLVDLLYYLAKDRFAHGCLKNESWYEFVEPRWRERHQGIFTYIPKILIDDALQVVKNYYQDRTPDGDLTKLQLPKLNQVIRAILNKQKHMIEQDAVPRFAVEDFVQNLDSKRSVISFTDCVYDFDLHAPREGRREDYVHMSTGYAFPHNSDPAIRARILQFFEEIQPDPVERRYLLTFLSTLIHGENREETFHIFTGTTRNGKSLLCDLLKHTLGDYYVTIAANMLTKERPSPSQPQPDVMCLKSKRVAVGSEPENGQKINTGYMKYITGNDMLSARGLYENKLTEFKPQFKLILLCNTIPMMDSNDQGVWSRSRIVNFPTTFTDNPTLPHEKKIDKTLKHKIHEWGPEFMLMLLEQFHQVYEVEGLEPTPFVLQKTREFKEDSDDVLQFLTAHLIASPKHVHLDTVYQHFLAWIRIHSPSTTVMSCREFNKSIKHYSQYTVCPVNVDGHTKVGIKNYELSS
ncbi:hypothetical protein SmJEL517_g06127 [Synchytrium microbalum]|uniref:SF3 helicase domain-containing protein n=1 Tax=Synchytrium microbalum TaxID=1806994 RepID=A0A507BX07_9FUNG|nr:uncharacterized protein SmJEL517_g06127 [Synchytrium microbalum]TPX30276.1 hypothetical protein SmJEL517_g06127 [Synchytrium microbalum]